MVSIDGLAVEFGGSTLFSDISFVINEKDRIALMGKNGAGKSTLLKILAVTTCAPTGIVFSIEPVGMLAIKKKHGKNAIVKGMNLEDGATAMERNGQVGGHNIFNKK